MQDMETKVIQNIPGLSRPPYLYVEMVSNLEVPQTQIVLEFVFCPRVFITQSPASFSSPGSWGGDGFNVLTVWLLPLVTCTILKSQLISKMKQNKTKKPHYSGNSEVLTNI